MGLKNGKPVLLQEHVDFLMKTSGRSEAEVRAKYQHFLKQHPDNKITKVDFKDMIEQVR